MENLQKGQIITVQPKHIKELVKAEIVDFKTLKDGKELIIIESENGNKFPISKAEIKESIIISEVDKVELLTNEAIKELKEVVSDEDIDKFFIDDTSFIVVNGANKKIYITIDNESIILDTHKEKDLDEDGNNIYRNRTERKTVKGILKYIEKHYY